LCDQLADGGRHLQTDIERAAESSGITKSRLRRSREKLCDTERLGGIGASGKWYWRLKSRGVKPGTNDGPDCTGEAVCDTPTTVTSKGANGSLSPFVAIPSAKVSGDDILGEMTSLPETPALDSDWEKV
jgi:hypothetical protein